MNDVMATWTPTSRVFDLQSGSLRPNLAPPSQGVISLAMGEPDFETPVQIVEAAKQALVDGHTHYADQQGLPALREVIATNLPGTTDLSASDILVTHGATGALAALVLSAVGPGDRVVIPEPGYSLYADLVRLAGGTVDFVPLAANKHWDYALLGEKLPGARMFVFSNPSNPTGVCHTRHELELLGEVLEGTQTLVVADEAYDRLVSPEVAFTSALEIDSLSGRVAYVQTFSKTFAMTGWRVGYLAAPRTVLKGALQMHRTFNGSVNTANQFGALRALTMEPEVIEPMLSEYDRRRKIVVEELASVEGISLIEPKGAFYALPRYSGTKPSAIVAEELKERGVLVRSGAEYGPSGEYHFRISFAASEDEIREGISRIRSYFGRS